MASNEHRCFSLEQPPVASDIFMARPTSNAMWDESDGVIYVGSGKAGLDLILRFLKRKGILRNKMSRIVVPDWLGTWVYAQVLNYAFPASGLDNEAVAVLCYHQYGFPQNMERVLEIAKSRQLVVIEDCAHAAGGNYKGKPLGAFGDFCLFSFSKYAFCFALGGVASTDPEFSKFVFSSQQRGSDLLRMFINGFKLIDELNLGRTSPIVPSWFDGARNMAYSRYGDQVVAGRRAVALWRAKKEHELAARSENFESLRSKVAHLGICDHIQDEGLSPYAVPLAIKSDKSALLVAALRDEGIRTGTYQFDFNRCVFEPDFRPTVLVPIHSGMSGDGMGKLVRTILRTL